MLLRTYLVWFKDVCSFNDPKVLHSLSLNVPPQITGYVLLSKPPVAQAVAVV